MTATAIASQIVTFKLGDELFAADIFSVERVLRYAAPTPVPNVPEWIEGVIDYQGRVVPVVNLRRRFELSDAAVRTDGRILVMTVDDEWVAATVDGVLDVSALDGAEQLDDVGLERCPGRRLVGGIEPCHQPRIPAPHAVVPAVSHSAPARLPVAP